MERACRANGQGQTTKETTGILARRLSKPRESLTPYDWSLEPKQASSLTPVIDDDDQIKI